MKSHIKYFKGEIYKIPRDQEQKYKAKYTDYREKINIYEAQARKIQLELDGDKVGLLALEQGIETKKRSYGKGVNEETQVMAAQGYDL